MTAYAKVLLIAIPLFFVLILIEWTASWFMGKKVFTSMDTISSLSAGMTNTLKSVMGLIVTIISYQWVYEHVALFHIETTWLVWGLSFLAIDLASYLHHRLAHSVNFFWNRHVIHHSSEEFNLACALRQSISKFVSLGFFFLLPAAILGLPPKIIATIAPLHLFLQFWYHTKLIGKLGWLEYIIVTPSQHRVHHAINDEYLDKNLSGIFCIWDRLFGTFQEELAEVPCVYGVKKAVETWNPIKINVLHMWQLTKDAWRAEDWLDKFRLWWKPTGWRPADVDEKYPVEYTIDPATQVKYYPTLSKNLQRWSWFQYLFTTLLVFHLIVCMADITSLQLFLYGGFLFLNIYSYTTLMDKDASAIWFEITKAVFGLGIIYSMGNWFSIENYVTAGTILMAAYLIISVVVVAYFVNFEIKTEGKLAKMKQLDWN
ncbi:MAG: alkylglycerol monooxygenase [Paraglaciecola sp.]|jgi:alkylglycerol monooxygenase